jgi:Xaa-Pro aminopeptidase
VAGIHPGPGVPGRGGKEIRLKKLLPRLEKEGLNAFLVSQADNRRYLSGFTGSAGYLLVTKKASLLLVDFRYTEQAQLQAPGWDIVEVKGAPHNFLPGLLAGQRIKTLGLEASHMSLTSYSLLQEAVKNGPNLVLTEGLVEGLRQVKEPGELALLKKAARLSDKALDSVIPHLKPGAAESELAWEIEKSMRERGSESLPFEPIVASGPQSAMPHARATARTLGEREPVLIDIGARVQGYGSDLSRTFPVGEADDNFSRIYSLVLEAQERALSGIRPGMKGEEADRLAREVIETAGYGERFGHGLGHGVGLAPHEAPHLGPNSQDVLEAGMAFTVEPGIYIPGWGGVRIEDLVVLEKDGPRLLSHAKKLRP